VIDSHCHLADEAFDPDLKDVIERAQAGGVTGALCILDITNREEGERGNRVCKLWPNVGLAVGIHPHKANSFADTLDSVQTVVYSALSINQATCAIGEIGLDYHYDFAPKSLQQEVFRRQIQLAREECRPVVIHTREADEDTVQILREEGRGEVRGVFHCFTGDKSLAYQALELGFYVSFSGIVTFPRAEGIREAAKLVPADRLLVETDAPYLSPAPYRGKRNEPVRVVRIVEALAEIRQQTVEQVSMDTEASFDSLFNQETQQEDTSKGLLR
jgi:TatD DNase family protein